MYVCIYLSKYMYVCMYVGMYVRMYVCMHVGMYIYMCVCVRTYQYKKPLKLEHPNARIRQGLGPHAPEANPRHRASRKIPVLPDGDQPMAFSACHPRNEAGRRVGARVREILAAA